MNAEIELFSTEKNDFDVALRENGQIVFLNHTFTMEYQKLMQRLITPIDISACISNAPQYRSQAIWDTGALVSCISNELVTKMGLSPVDSGVGVTPTGQIEIMYYFVTIYLSKDTIIRNVRVAGFPLENHDVDFLIGMDIILKGNLNIDNSKGRTIFTFETTN